MLLKVKLYVHCLACFEIHFLKIFIAKKVCTECSGATNKIVTLTNLNEFSYNDRSEIEVNVNNSSENALQTNSTLGETAISAECASRIS